MKKDIEVVEQRKTNQMVPWGNSGGVAGSNLPTEYVPTQPVFQGQTIKMVQPRFQAGDWVLFKKNSTYEKLGLITSIQLTIGVAPVCSYAIDQDPGVQEADIICKVKVIREDSGEEM